MDAAAFRYARTPIITNTTGNLHLACGPYLNVAEILQVPNKL